MHRTTRRQPGYRRSLLDTLFLRSATSTSPRQTVQTPLRRRLHRLLPPPFHRFRHSLGMLHRRTGRRPMCLTSALDHYKLLSSLQSLNYLENSMLSSSLERHHIHVFVVRLCSRPVITAAEPLRLATIAKMR
ncbi:uncharacterized protein PHACADRAFT_258593 [Phanerochaete carnosa HHB-10118-sp]|uniref:Uncharacterized protein n=1 Tax=Phanerochaete carnosa (strain HHB-10118-sp) TaxID=650164 RepID=K5W621_PHACS|nr:uncharacterized protein PHACADRAFT_258593 [Phanerochaete carnosa HHB-10118-sp]EKM54615.1 hypothetical protein PHACADRAFT_258593 [Phanerochaete carnosa HHB-10118-sp]